MRILVVEDEHRLADVIKEGLVEESYAVDVCYDGDSGLLYALDEEYDAIILDRMLPGELNGMDVCAALRKANNTTPIIMLTAMGKVEDRVEGLNSGADDYLVKPFAFEELLARIRALTRRPHDSLGEVLSSRDLQINTNTKVVTRAGTIIHLSAKEYAILELLLRSKGKVLSKSVIMNHVWNFDSTILPSTVEVFIVYLRAKIEKPFNGPKIIETVRGFGYKVENI